MDAKELEKIRDICRRFKLGPIQLHDSGKITLFSNYPMEDKIYNAFPMAEVIESGCMEDVIYQYFVEFYPERE